MATSVKITQIGNSVGVVIPKETLNRLKVEKGDSLHIVDHPNGLLLSPYDEEFSKQMEAMRYVMKKHRDVLRMLAKS